MPATAVILPKLGLTMDEGRIVAWRKREGEPVAQGEILFEVETDKATMEVESPVAGVVRRILAAAGATVPVAETIAVITTTADEPIPAAFGGLTGRTDGGGLTVAAEPPSSGPLDASSSSAPSADDRVRASPAARKKAAELGIDVATVAGRGPGGRITIEDVEAATKTAASTAAGERREPLSRMRRAIAERMSRSAREAPQFQISRDVDMTAADALRRREGVSYTDVLVAACARALARHPRFRSRFDADALAVADGVHVGLAVALDDGLLVPVIRDADRKDLATIASERARLEEGARAGKLLADALTGAVFTISNLGTLGVDRFTALVAPPEAAILAVGRVADRVVARDGQVAIRPMVSLTLSVDHRVADGADAASFLADVVRWLESGGSMEVR